MNADQQRTMRQVRRAIPRRERTRIAIARLFGPIPFT
jgi:hypothetical protein